MGKSLLKYFKPVKITLPHSRPYAPEEVESLNNSSASDLNSESLKSEFKLIQFKKKDAKPTQVPKAQETELAQEIQPAVSKETDGNQKKFDKNHTHWIELILTLLHACKKASDNMRLRVGIQTYKKALQGKGQHKIRTLGSIVNIQTTDKELKSIKKTG